MILEDPYVCKFQNLLAEISLKLILPVGWSFELEITVKHLYLAVT